MMSEPSDDGISPGGAALSADDRAAIETSIRDFAEGASAMAAAAIRIQMMMLEQTREMLGEFDAMMGKAAMRDDADS